MKRKIDYSIYLVTDRDLMSSDTIERAVEDAILGGVTLVQLREKGSDSTDFYAEAVRVKELCDRYNVPLIINDRIDIALAVDAAGVHIGQSDIPASIARKMLGNDKILGVSATNLAEAIKAKRDGADYLGVGAMFLTDTKTDAKIVSLDELKSIIDEVNLPTVLIGGINEKTIPQFSEINIDGVAVVSAIIAQTDIKAAAGRIKEIFWWGRQPLLRGIKGVIFDLDGTLIDSMNVWETIDIEFMRRRGLDVPDDLIVKICAMSFKEAAEYTIDRFALDDKVEDVMAEWYNMAIEHYTTKVKLYPHALEYLLSTKKQGLRMAVATGLSKDLFLPCLLANGVVDLFDILLSVNDVGKGKESDDIYRLAFDKLGLAPAECLIFEDILPAVKTAKSTGAVVYAVREKYSLPQAAEIKATADGYIDDFSKAPVIK